MTNPLIELLDNRDVHTASLICSTDQSRIAYLNNLPCVDDARKKINDGDISEDDIQA